MGLILNFETICEVSKQLREQNKKIVLTHGCYDIHHIGQAEFLRQSKKLGDILIVAVDDDIRIKKYKSPKRPIISLEYRAGLLEHSAHIDLVLPLEHSSEVSEEFYIDLYKKINPHIIAFGRVFGAKNFIEKRAEDLKDFEFIEIAHKYDNVLSSTEIIERSKKA